MFVLSAAVVLSTVGCQGTKTKAVEGGVIGGVLGAAVGGIIGHQKGRGLEGAAIGGAIGATGGAVVGSQMAKPGVATGAQPQATYSNPNQMSIQQIVALVGQGVNEAVIIDRIRVTNSVFALSMEQINYLRQQGVTQPVIDVMSGM